jgi:hypothetical protein
MTFEAKTGLNVSSHYGPHSQREGIEGHRRTEGSIQELVLYVTSENINDDVFNRNLAYLPVGAYPKEVYVDVDDAFTLTGTSPTISIGTEGSETTNGFDISESQAESTGSYVISSFNGTWDSQLGSDTYVGIDLGGTNPTTSGGYARITIRYYSG